MDLPEMVPHGDGLAPAAPTALGETGVEATVLADLALKAAYITSSFNTEWTARRLHLPQPLVGELLEGLREDRLLEILGEAGPFGFRYAATQRGRERAARLLELSGYVGPAPVSLAAYTAMLQWQLARAPAVTHEDVAASLKDLVLPAQAEQLAGLAASSGRSLFLYGPPGNGKGPPWSVRRTRGRAPTRTTRGPGADPMPRRDDAPRCSGCWRCRTGWPTRPSSSPPSPPGRRRPGDRWPTCWSSRRPSTRPAATSFWP
jgi:hypothetical protein